MKLKIALILSIIAHLCLLFLLLGPHLFFASSPSLENNFLLQPKKGEIFVDMAAGAGKKNTTAADRGEAIKAEADNAIGSNSAATAGSSDIEAQPMGEVKPQYPAMSQRLEEEGETEITVEVSAEGLPISAQISRSSGFQRLDEAARAALLTARFQPASTGGAAAPSRITKTVVFRLKNTQAFTR